VGEHLVKRPSALDPVHPGEVLREDVLPALRLTVTAAADMLKVSRQTLHGILAGKAGVSADMAVRIGKLCGNGPNLWLNLQKAYDLRQAELRLKDVVATIPTLQAIQSR
jgi:addiction module HigA family antidote